MNSVIASISYDPVGEVILKILLVNPPKVLLDKIGDKSNFLVYDNWKFTFYHEQTEFTINVDEYLDENSSNKTHNFSELELLKLHAIWIRWLRTTSKSQALAFALRCKLDQVLKILDRQFVTKAYFFTSIPHHIDTSIISACCSKLDIVENYFYGGIIFDRMKLLLKISGSGILPERKVSANGKHDPLIMKEIEKFASGISQGKKAYWLTGHAFLYQSFVVALGAAAYLFLKNVWRKNNFFDSHTNRLMSNVSDIMSQRQYLKYYDAESRASDLSDVRSSDVFIAAHYQPEATTVPEGGKYSNHIDIILQLKVQGFSGKIYYKEHPSSKSYLDPMIGMTGVGGYRSKEYLAALKSLGVILVPFDKPANLFRDCVVVTCTGSIAIERSLLGLSTVVAGVPYFNNMPGVVKLCELTKDYFCLARQPDENLVESAKLYLAEVWSGNAFPDLKKTSTDAAILCYMSEFQANL